MFTVGTTNHQTCAVDGIILSPNEKRFDPSPPPKKKKKKKTLRPPTTPTHHEQYEHVDDGHARVDEHGQPPVGGDGVRDGEQQRAHVVEHVGDGREGAAQVGLAHLADVRGARAAGGPDAQAHQHGRGVQRGHAVRVEQRRHGGEVRPVGQHHAHVVPEPGHQRGRQHAAGGREQEQQAACGKIERRRSRAGPG